MSLRKPLSSSAEVLLHRTEERGWPTSSSKPKCQREKNRGVSLNFREGQMVNERHNIWTNMEEGVAYPLAADNVSRPLVSRLKGLHQPVVRPRIRFSAPRSRLLVCL